MKRLIKTLALTFVVILLAASLTSCNKLGGRYASDDTAYKFSLIGDKVVMIYLDFEIKGEYEIDEKNGKIYMTFLGDRQEYSYSKNGKTLIIDGVEYVKD